MTEPFSPIRVFAAGSLRHALPAIIEAFNDETGLAASLSLGPAGLLRERIEAGEPFDLFASANMAHPHRLAATGVAEAPTCFAHNRLCVIARAELGLTEANFLSVLANPSLRIGTSTPGDDPAGDYAFEMLDRVEAERPGLGLKQRARQLVGGRNTPPLPPNRGSGWAVTEGLVDLMVSYWSNARLSADDPAFSIVAVPPALAPAIDYGVALAAGAGEGPRRLLGFLLSDRGRSILIATGFQPASRDRGLR
ncbi:substrate-binding domain-containing protein [Pleomorphomonas oryzae]|uniref:substrate-binding domain-containing protein n=1 Tax=Pleomorphomonas oryzae TaxID=261934 RepID=UPI00042A014D|nr:substrate-binding domain-containing protein [Pleomorphomonas oryzae]